MIHDNFLILFFNLVRYVRKLHHNTALMLQSLSPTIPLSPPKKKKRHHNNDKYAHRHRKSDQQLKLNLSKLVSIIKLEQARYIQRLKDQYINDMQQSEIWLG